MALRYPLRITHHGFGLVPVTHYLLPVTCYCFTRGTDPKNEGLTPDVSFARVDPQIPYGFLKEYQEWLKINQHVEQKTNGGDSDATKNHD